MTDHTTPPPATPAPPPTDPALELSTEPVMGTYQFDPFELDLATHCLTREGTVIPVGVKAFDTLVALLKNQHRVVTKEELIKWVWPDSFVSEDSLTHTISAVRRALGDDPTQPRYISTVARRGYRFIAPVRLVRPTVTGPEIVQAAAPVAVPEPAAVAVVTERIARSRRGPLIWVGAGALAALVVVLGFQRFAPSSSASGAPRPFRFVQALPLGTTLASGGVLSPDGNYLTFAARDDRSGRTQLWLRSLDSVDAAPIEGTDGATRPFWSPDSRFIAFFAGSRLMRVSVEGGAPQSLTPTINSRPAGGSWSTGGVILYADGGNLYSVPASGGAAALVGEPEGGAFRYPTFLPDGRRFLVNRASLDAENAGTYIRSLDAPELTRILDGGASSVTYATDGYLAYVRDRVLLAHRFDGTRLMGDALPLAGNVTANAMISVAANGVLAFGGGITAEGLMWFDRSGRPVGSLSGTVPLNNMALSPDQRQLIGSSADANQPGVWMVDLDRSVATRVMLAGGSPLWSPDGAQLAYVRGRGGREVGVRPLAGGEEQVFWASDATGKVLNDWSRDGRHLVYVIPGERTKNDIWYISTGAQKVTASYANSAANEIQAQVSPDGRWIAYASDESGTWNVYVDSFPVGGAKRAVSTGGGAQPQWRGDGRELYFLSLDNQMMAASMADNGTLQVGRTQALFRAPVLGSLTDYRNLYTVTRDGNRFLVKSIAPDGYQEPITLLINWQTLARP